MKKLTDMFRTTSEVDETQGPVEEETLEEVTSNNSESIMGQTEQ